MFFPVRNSHVKVKQELLGQFSRTVEQKLYHWELRNNDE
jgi:hypothetical protein